MEVSNRRLLFAQNDRIPRSSTILVVDSDIGNLNILSPALHYFGYRVITRQTAAEALYLLRQSAGEFDLLLTELFLPDSDGFEFLTAVTTENTYLPVVAFSAYLGYADVAVQALQRGACAFYRKPIAAEILRHLWQHAFHKKIQSCRGDHVATPLLALPPPLLSIPPPVLTLQPPKLSAIVGKAEEAKRKGGVGDERKNKKSRARWSPELHEKFMAAVQILAGEEKVLPGRILECMERMGVEGLNRDQISSHLQQYKKKMKKSAEEQIQSDHNNNSDSKTCSDNQVGEFCSEQGMSDQYSSGTMSQCSEDVENSDWVMQFIRFD